MKAMIFAAGLGTRLKPLTDTMPKALVTVDGKPLLQHLMEKLRCEGFDRVVINVHHFADQVVDFVHAHGGFGLEVSISDERSGLLDTGGGLRRAAPLIWHDGDVEPVLVHNVDILSNVSLADLVRRHDADRDAVLVVSRRVTQRYLLFDRTMRLQGWTNVSSGEVRPDSESLRALLPELQPFAFSGIHSLSPRLFPLMDRFPDRFGIIDFYLSVCHRSRVVGLPKDDLRVLDVGKLDTLQEAERFFSDNGFYELNK